MDCIGVVGAGLMGHGIALQFAVGGYEVSLTDTSEKNLQLARENIDNSLTSLVELGLVDDATASDVPGRIHTIVPMAQAMDKVNFVVEAVYEDLALKQEVFAQLDKVCPPDAVLTSNTSSFMTSQLASSTARPDKVLVANWWNPPFLLPLVEVVRGPDTSDETVETATAIFESVGKKAVVLSKESLGFIGNRMQFALLREALFIVDNGIASAEDVDTVVKTSFGRRLAVAGPFEVFDIAGWDTISKIIDQLFPDLDSTAGIPTSVSEMVSQGELGVKSGSGFYKWDNKSVGALRRRIASTLSMLESMSQET